MPPRALIDPGPPHAGARAIAQAYRMTLTAADVMARLGREASADTERWLDPKLAQLTPPFDMVDRGAASERIASAIRRNEPVAIFGDYDCDGVTATAIMTTLIRSLGGDARPVLATRTEGAYGLSDRALERVRATGAKLLVTCDCGSSDHERIETAKRAGIDTVVIDHHLVPKDPLPALAFLNPHRPDCGFPFKHLASCGLAFNLGAALRAELKRELDLKPLLDLVAIGTVADVAPLVGDNRALVRAGLRVISAGVRPGLRALANLARIDLSQGVTSEDIGYRIAPRLNAPGRLADPDDSLALLLARDWSAAETLAASIEQVQLQRRALQQAMLDEAMAELGLRSAEGARPIASLPDGIVVARQGWHAGIVGIVAGKLAELTQRPTIVIALEGETGRGSVRGPAGFHLYDALTRCTSELIQFGGHQAAAGVHVRADRVAEFTSAWVSACAALGAEKFADRRAEPVARLAPDDQPGRVLADLERLEPFGEGNPAPLLFLPGVVVRSARNLKGHLKLDLAYEGRALSAVFFSHGHLAEQAASKKVDIAGALRRDAWSGGAEVHVVRTSPPFGE
ncbi:MAG: single-stranded-DNA-specific exonuclease RecJ [Polyangiaceae bacterium]